jgi:hypothetical protein
MQYTTLIMLAMSVAVTAETKHGNNGSVSCHTFCRGDWGQRRFQSCSSAVDTVTGKSIPCGLTRGFNVKEVTCECSDTYEQYKHGNNGVVSCTQFCQGDWGTRKFGKCEKAVDTATGYFTWCDKVRGYNVKEVLCACTDNMAAKTDPELNKWYEDLAEAAAASTVVTVG